MTAIERVIRDAAKGGYAPCEFTPYDSISCGTPAQQTHGVTHVWFNNSEGEGCGFPIWQIFLDREFWQALGKSLGWGKAITYKKRVKNWKEQWHDFIRHLIKGHDPEAFFADLLANTK